MIVYDKLFKLLEEKGLKRTLLLTFLSSKTIAKLGKGENVSTETIDALCFALDCQPSDIMEYVPEQGKTRKDISVIEKWKQAFMAGRHYYDEKSIEETMEQPPTDSKTIEDGIRIVSDIMNQK